MLHNVQKIRKEQTSGEFTTIHYSILRDKNLSSNAKILLFEIFSDKDYFNLSQTLYCNRLGWKPQMFKLTINELAQSGYLSRIVNNPKKGTYYYTVSEFGNLEKESSKPKKTKPNKDEISNDKQEVKEDITSLENEAEIVAKNDMKEEYVELVEDEIKPTNKEDKPNFINDLLDFIQIEDITETINKISDEEWVKISKYIDEGYCSKPHFISIKNHLIKRKIELTPKITVITETEIKEMCLLKKDRTFKSIKDFEAFTLRVIKWFRENPNVDKQKLSTKITQIKTSFREACNDGN